MAGAGRGPDRPLSQVLLEEGYRFSFFQAVRLLQHLAGDAPRMGHQGPVARERIRLRPKLDLSFAPGDVADVREVSVPGGGKRYEMTTTFLSLYGTVSPLPTYFTEQLLLDQEEEGLQRGFLDLFHHRLLGLFYRTWEKYRYDVQFAHDGGDAFSRRLLALLALDADRLPRDHRVPAVRLLGFAGLLTQCPHSAASLRGVLLDYFEGIDFDIRPCVGRWLPVPADQRCRLGLENGRLGADAVLGDRVYDRSCTFRVEAGPLGLKDFLEFLPSGGRIAELRELVDLVNGDCLDCEVELRLRVEEAPPLTLGSDTARLGWSSWLGRPRGDDPRVRFLVKGWFHGRG